MNPYDYAIKLISIHLDLGKAWKLKDEIADFHRSATLETAPKEIKNIIQNLLNSEINELIRFGYTMINWKKEIIHLPSTELYIMCRRKQKDFCRI